jgi:hypothetical protein
MSMVDAVVLGFGQFWFPHSADPGSTINEPHVNVGAAEQCNERMSPGFHKTATAN